MKTLLNSEYVFCLGTVKLTLYLDYEHKTFDIKEPDQKGVFYGQCSNILDGELKSELLVKIMKFVRSELKEHKEGSFSDEDGRIPDRLYKPKPGI